MTGISEKAYFSSKGPETCKQICEFSDKTQFQIWLSKLFMGKNYLNLWKAYLEGFFSKNFQIL